MDRPPQDTPRKLCQGELDALEARRKVTNAAMRNFVGDTFSNQAAEELPRVAVCFSGGGIRALLGAQTYLDAASAIGFLDCVEYVSGVSGSTWCLSSWGCFEGNIFHRSLVDPWSKGQKYDRNIHKAEGAKYLLQPERLKSEDWISVREKKLGSVFKWFSSGGVFENSHFFDIAKSLAAHKGETISLIDEWESYLFDLIIKPYVPDNSVYFSAQSNPVLKRKQTTGEIPIIICSAVTDNYGQIPPQMRFNTVEFTAFEVCVLPHGAPEAISAQKFGKKATVTGPAVPLSKLLATWGSAFGFDWKHVLDLLNATEYMKYIPSEAFKTPLKPVAEHIPMFSNLFNVKNATATFPKFHSDDTFRLRDSGVTLNVSFPVVGKKSGRDIDVIIVGDSGEAAKGCEELKEAFNQGVVDIRDDQQDLLNKEFGDEFFKIFWPKHSGDPIIVYFQLINNYSTCKFGYSESEIEAAKTLYHRLISKHVQDVLKYVLVEAHKRKIERKKSQNIPLRKQLPSSEIEKFRDWLQKFYQQKKYSQIGLLTAGFTDSDREFTHLFTKLSMKRYNQQFRELGDSYMLSDIIDLFNQDKTRIVIEGPGGSGKSTICKYLAREQEFNESFNAVIMVELLLLRSLFPEPKEPVTLVELLSRYFGVDNPGELGAQLEAGKQSILWIFDGYDEVDSIHGTNHQEFHKFIKNLREDGLSWVQHIVISSRPERAVRLGNYIQLRMEPWTREEVDSYVERFFANDPIRKRRVCNLLNHDSISEFSSTPLFCELVCTVHQNTDETGLNLLQIYQKFIDLIWDRSHSHGIDTTKIELFEVRTSAQKKLFELAYEAYQGTNIVTLKILDPVDQVLYRSGFFQETTKVSQHVVEARFVHKVLLEYCCAQYICSREYPLYFLQKILNFEESQRLLISFVTHFHTTQTKTNTQCKWKPYLDYIAGVQHDLVTKHQQEIAKVLKNSDDNWYLREKLRNKLGSNIMMETLSILEANLPSTEKSPSEAFLYQLQPYLTSVVSWLGEKARNAWAPPFYRLFLEPAARFGNLTAVKWIIQQGGSQQSDINMAALEALAASKAHVLNYLQQEKKADISLPKCVQAGFVDGIKYILNGEQLPRDHLKALQEACQANNTVLTAFCDHKAIQSQVASFTLNNTKITAFPVQLSNLTKLKHLDLGSNRIRSLPIQIGLLTNLKELTLRKNSLKSLPKDFSKLTNLARLYIGSNPLHTVPLPICSLTGLWDLGLGAIELTTLEPKLKNLSKLRILRLGGNKLAHLPEHVSNLTSLTELHLGGNKLQSLPEGLACLTNLTRLEVNSNNLQSITESISKLCCLRTLYLAENPELLQLPQQLFTMTTINKLTLDSWLCIANNHENGGPVKPAN